MIGAEPTQDRMPRGLDHIVHAVRDLDAAAEFYRRLGFMVGVRNRHPWGTHNHIVQLPGFFIELLTVAEPSRLGSDGFSKLFGAFNRDFLAHQQGLSLLILDSKDATADETAFGAAGIAASPALRFEREGRRPDGSAVKVAFSLVFARAEGAPQIGFAVCQQHYPENFWNPEFQRHDNGAAAIAGVVLVAEQPKIFCDFLAAYCGRKVEVTESAIAVETRRGAIEIATPAVFREQYRIEPPDVTAGARLAAVQIAVRDPGATAAMLKMANVDFSACSGGIVVGPRAGMGAAFVFEPLLRYRR